MSREVALRDPSPNRKPAAMQNPPLTSSGKKKSVFRRGVNGFLKALSALPKNRQADKLVSYARFVASHGRLPSNADLFNDVLYRLKTSDEILDPLRVFVSDKEFVKLYIKATVGDQYNIPTLAVLRSPKAVDDFEFPARCCIKATHASGRVILRTHGEPVDKDLMKSWFSFNYYRKQREANYKTLKPKVIVEPLLFDSDNVEDYRFFCFEGRVKMIMIDMNIRDKPARRRLLFDAEWNVLPFSIGYPKASQSLPRPANFDEMLDVVHRLCQPFGFIRVDLYSRGDQLFAGEITNTHADACQHFIPPSAESLASKLIFSDRAIGSESLG
jgi:TupA-like ATPgrasp